MARLEAQNVHKRFASTVALADFSHGFADGKITVVLGPSGSGKSTLLNLLAGLATPAAGRLSLDGEDITARAAEQRDFGLVFQNYALFPHLSVAENVAFGLKVRGVSTGERERRVGETLELVRIPHLAARRIHQISGGEQQRVAIARAIAFRPRVLLMDEPLSALDARLRDDLRTELSALLRSLATTTIYVTHDQVEALSLGDELVILHAGRIEQTGTPQEVYRRPASSFVAGFLGAANVIAAECHRDNGAAIVTVPFARIPHDHGAAAGPCWAVIRPEDLEISAQPSPGSFPVALESSAFLGSRLRLHVIAAGEHLVVETSNGLTFSANAPLFARLKPDRLTLLPRGKTERPLNL